MGADIGSCSSAKAITAATVLARHLAAAGQDVTVINAVRPEQLGGDAAVERDIIESL